MNECTVSAGAASVDITPPPGLLMCGYAARTEPALGQHDPLTARALVVDDTAIVVADVLGLHEQTCAAIRRRSGFADDRIVVVATHTHGGPLCMPGRCGGEPDPGFLQSLEDGCVEAVKQAARRRQPARLLSGNGADPGIASNRRTPGGVVDPTVPVLRVEGLDGTPLAIAFAHGCHPVVLGAGNRLYTSDFPYFAREALERASPTAVALFLPGCSGDVATGHSPESSIGTSVPPDRTFAEAERLGHLLAGSVLAAGLTPLDGSVNAHSSGVELSMERRETEPLDALEAHWRELAGRSDPAWAALYEHWAGWAATTPRGVLEPWRGRVTACNWGGQPFVFLPGEIFATTAMQIRAGQPAGVTPFVVSLTDGVPGYIPPLEAYAVGGYEVDEAHRYYGLPATFAPGSAEALASAATDCARSVLESG